MDFTDHPLENFEDDDIHTNGGDDTYYCYFFHIEERFATVEHAILWVKDVALRCGFEIIVSSIKQSRTVKYMKCNRGGRPRNNGRNLIHATRKRSKSIKCECPFQIKIDQLKYGEWIIIVADMNGYHNHPLYKSPGGLTQHCKLSKEAKEAIRDNCGFRVVASFCFDTEDRYVHVQLVIANEISAKRTLYESIYISRIDEAIERISWTGGRCERMYWMTVLEDLYLIATFFNLTIIFIAHITTPINVCSCFTILLLHKTSAENYPCGEIGIAYLERPEHFVRLNLTANCPPPPIPTTWFKKRDSSVHGWENYYIARSEHGDILVNM